MTLPHSEIKAITKLLKTQDESTYKLLEEQFINFDSKLLHKINSQIPSDDIQLKNEFLKLISRTKSTKIKKDFISWSTSPTQNLEEGVFLIASFNDPMLDTEHYSDILNKWADKLEKNLKKIKVKNDPTSIINEINHYLFMEIGLMGNKENYYSPENSFINKVLETSQGNPILLSVIYLLISKRLGLPFEGVNMPAHFLVQYMDSIDSIYIDPFNQGEIIKRDDCKERIKALKMTWHNEFLSAPSNKQILARIMQNLINIYHSEGNFESKECLED